MSKKIFYPSADRNKIHILNILKQYIIPDEEATLLEISSGTGQHSSLFASHFPKIQFQPSEVDKSLFDSIQEYAAEAPTKNINKPLQIDVRTDASSWNLPTALFDYIVNINMIHVSPIACSDGLFRNVSKILKPNGLLFTYGAYAVNGVLIPESNVQFDRSIRAQNSEWGVRDIKDLKVMAESYGISLVEMHDLPANNKCVVWRKD